MERIGRTFEKERGRKSVLLGQRLMRIDYSLLQYRAIYYYVAVKTVYNFSKYDSADFSYLFCIATIISSIQSLYFSFSRFSINWINERQVLDWRKSLLTKIWRKLNIVCAILFDDLSPSLLEAFFSLFSEIKQASHVRKCKNNVINSFCRTTPQLCNAVRSKRSCIQKKKKSECETRRLASEMSAKFRANFKPFVSNPFAPLRYLDPRGHPAGLSRRERDRGSGCARSFLAWPCTKRRRGSERTSVQPVRRVTPKSFSSRYDSLLCALDYMDHPVYRALKCSSKNLRSMQRGARPRSLAFLRARWCIVRDGLTHSIRVL